MAGNRTVFTSDMSNEECFNKMLELTKSTQGNWLIMHRDVIEYSYTHGWMRGAGVKQRINSRTATVPCPNS